MIKRFFIPLLAGLVVVCWGISCQKDKPSADKSNATPITISGITINNSEVGKDTVVFENTTLNMVVNFSAPVNVSLLSGNISVPSDIDATINLDDSKQKASISLSGLDLNQIYTIKIPVGKYGASGGMLNDSSVVNLKGVLFHEVTEPPVIPSVTLSADETFLLEGNTASLAATLSESAPMDIVINLKFEGTADGSSDIKDIDFDADSRLVIPQGELTGSVDINATESNKVKGLEILRVSIDNIQSNAAVEETPQTVTLLINKPNEEGLMLKGVTALRWSKEGSGSSGKALHFVATKDIADLSVYGYGVASNGTGSKGQIYTFPNVAVQAGDEILVTRDKPSMQQYFGDCFGNFNHVFEASGGGVPTQNGDDAIEVYKNGTVIEIFGDRSYKNYPSYELLWDYTESWVYKEDDGKWKYVGSKCVATSTGNNASSNCVYPLCN